MFLSKEEVAELTGAKIRSLQIQNLQANGIRHTIRHDGWPCVARDALAGSKSKAAEPGGWSPRKAS